MLLLFYILFASPASCSYTYYLPHLQQLPQCQNDGKFAAKQCRGDKVLGRLVM